jgi:hypothetical protein
MNKTKKRILRNQGRYKSLRGKAQMESTLLEDEK